MNMGIPSRLRAVSPGRRARCRSGSCPRAPSCWACVWARKLAPRNTVCLPYFSRACPRSRTGVTGAASGSPRQRGRAGHRTLPTTCSGSRRWRGRGCQPQRGRQTQARSHGEDRWGNWSGRRGPPPDPIVEVLGPEKDEHTLGGELVLPEFDAGVLQVFRQLGEDQCPVARGRGEGFDLLDGMVGLMLHSDQLEDIRAVELLPDLIKGLGEVLLTQVSDCCANCSAVCTPCLCSKAVV